MSGEMLRRHPSKRNTPADKNVGRTLGCKFSGSDGEHVRVAAETIGEKQDVGVTRGRSLWPEMVHPDGDSRSRTEGDRGDMPTNRQSRFLPRLALLGAATSVRKRSFLSTNRNVRACGVYRLCQYGRKQSMDRLAIYLDA